MKNIGRILASVCTFLLIVGSAQAAGIDHFKLTLSPESASIGEALDLTIEAVDKNDTPVTDYTGRVLIFSSTNPKVELPIALQDSMYQFTEADQGKVKFENGVKFGLKGVQDLNVYDYADDTVFGVTEIEVSGEEQAQNLDIDILSPETGLTVPNDTIKVSGTTKKNHNVVVMVNDKEKFETTSNSSGVFEVEVNNLENGENTISAQVLDADNKVVGESKAISLKVDNKNSVLKNLKVVPEEVFTESVYEIEVTATKGLSKVEAIVNDELIRLSEKENEQGVYTGNGNAPRDKGTYNIDIVLVGELGNEVKEMGAGEIKVKALEAAPPVQKEPEPVNEPDEPVVVVEPTNGTIKKTPVVTTQQRDPLKITGIKLVELKTKSILTWNSLVEAKGYNIYKRNLDGSFDLVDTVSEARYEVDFANRKEVTHEHFAIKAIGIDKKGDSYEGDLSQATKVKTGPEMILLLVISLLLGGMFFITNSRRKS